MLAIPPFWASSKKALLRANTKPPVELVVADLEKTIAEITVADVLRMVRQKEFTNLAMSKAISFLQEDVFAGESYEGELLEKVSEMDSSFLISYADDLKNIINNALVKSETRDWTYDGEEEEFKDMIDALSTKVM